MVFQAASARVFEQSKTVGFELLGFDYMVDDHQGLFVTVQRLFVDTTITGTVDPSIPGLGGAPASADIDLDPVIVFAGYTYRF